jgi:thioester reductase-like protein
VRATDPEAGFSRIRKTMEEYRVWNEQFAIRIHPVIGDIAKPLLGINPEEYAQLAGAVSVIYHCGALVNFVYPYSALRGPNVIGTREVLRLAATSRVKAVHYTSTVDVLLGTHMQRPFLENSDSLEHPNEIPDGYARSKWIAEKMLLIARSRGIPVNVYRPGLVMGHTTTGATQTNDYLLISLKGFLDLGIISEPAIMIDFVPVDFIAATIVYLSQQASALGKYYHIWNPTPVHMSRAYEWIQSYGYRFDILSRTELRDNVLKRVDTTNALYPFLPLFRAMREDPPMSSHDPSIVSKIDLAAECANTFQALRGSGIYCPPLTEDMAHRCFSYLTEIGFLPKPITYD